MSTKHNQASGEGRRASGEGPVGGAGRCQSRNSTSRVAKQPHIIQSLHSHGDDDDDGNDDYDDEDGDEKDYHNG